MTDRVAEYAPRWKMTDISAALLSIPHEYLLMAASAGCTNDEGCRLARAKIDDHVRRRLAPLADEVVARRATTPTHGK